MVFMANSMKSDPDAQPLTGKQLARTRRVPHVKVLRQRLDMTQVEFAEPRGGVPVAAEVATALAAPLDLILVRKIGVPDQPELAMGAVVDGGDPIIVRNEDIIELAGIGQSEFKAVCDREPAARP
jgi:putative phosphoribosyl transferase